jgi:hypothetical protein
MKAAFAVLFASSLVVGLLPASSTDTLPGPFENMGQFSLAILMIVNQAFSMWWASYQRGKTEDRQARLLEVERKYQADKEIREMDARERELDRADRRAERAIEAARLEILNQTHVLKESMDENTRTTTETLHAANNLTEKVRLAGAMRKTDIEANGKYQRRAEDKEEDRSSGEGTRKDDVE